MELTREEFEVLWNIKEGASDTLQLPNFVEFPLEKIKEILEKLESEGLIELKKEDESWDAKTIDKAEPLFEKYKSWIPA